MDNPTASLLGYLVGGAAGIFLGAVVVQYATKWLAGFKPKYGITCLAVLIAYVASLAIGFVIGLAISMNRGEATSVVTTIIVAASFFAQAGFYSFMLKRPDGTELGFGRACLVSLVQTIVVVVALVVIVLMVAGAASLAEAKGVQENPNSNASFNVEGVKAAALRGDPAAQNNFGVAYRKGQGVTRDDVEAYKWYCLAAAQGNKYAIANRDNLLPSLTPEQVAEGQRRVAAAEFERDFYEKYPDLRSYGPLVDAVASRLQESGYTGESREAVMETFARAAREEINRRQQAQPANPR